MDPEIRTALRSMSAKQREAILGDPSSGALKARARRARLLERYLARATNTIA